MSNRVKSINQTGEGASIHGYSPVVNCVMVLRGIGRRGVGKLGGVDCAMVLEGMREAFRRKYKWGFWETGHLF